ncbi:EamA family transporter, partial [Mesorhizobium sp. B1-1-5]
GVAEPSLRIVAACVLITGGAALAAKSLFLRKPAASESGAGASEGGARA